MASRLGRPLKQLDGLPEADQAFATRLRQMRLAATITQEELASRVGFSRGYLAQLERGERRPTGAFLAALAQALPPGAQDQAHAPAGQARQQASELIAHPAALAAPVLASLPLPPASHAAVDWAGQRLSEYTAADNRFGGLLPLHPVEAHASVLAVSVGPCPDDVRQVLLPLASRYAELCGWLYHDSCQLDRAYQWTDFALTLAIESGDPVQTAYVLGRKSLLLTDLGQPARAVRLAEQALGYPGLSEQRQAVLLRQLAWALGSLDRQADCEQALDKAAALVDPPGGHDPEVAYATGAYVASEKARCYLRLKEPDLALTALAEADWGGQQQPNGRDWLLARTRGAAASLAVGDRDIATEQALAVASHARGQGIVSGQLVRELDSVIWQLELDPDGDEPGLLDWAWLQSQVRPNRSA